MECNLSFNITQNPAFRELIELTAGRNVTIPSTNDIMKTLCQHSNLMKEKLIEKIAKQKYVCTTCDVWSSRAQSYFGMTIHFLNSNFKRESYVLAFREMKYKQTNKEINEIIRQIFRDYKVDPKKVTHIVTYGGSAFCKAFKLFGKRVDTLIEPTTTDHSNEDDNEDNANDMPFIQFEDGEPFYSNIIDLSASELDILNGDQFDIRLSTEELDDFSDNDAVIEEEEDEFNDIGDASEMSNDSNNPSNQNREQDIYDTLPLPPHRRCLSHLLNLLGGDFENSLTGRTKDCFIATQNKLQSIWVFPRKSSKAKSYSKDILGCSLLIPCATRWNSKFDSFSKVLNLGQDKMNSYIAALKTNLKSAAHLSKLEKDDWTMITLYVKVMKPVAISLDRLQGERDCGQGFILPTLFTMKHKIKSLEGGRMTKACVDTMLNAIEKRFSAFFKIDYSNKELLLAAVSNPRFKTNFIEHDVDCAIVKEMFISECRRLYSFSEIHNFENIDSETNGATDDFFVSYASRRETRRRSSDTVMEDEINRYLEDNRTEYDMLHGYTNVKDMFFRNNTTLSASAAVERVFSQSSLIFTPRRNRLLTENFERLLILKHNRKALIESN